MTRGLTAGEISALESNALSIEDHVKITFRTSTSLQQVGILLVPVYTTTSTLRYTTGPLDTVVSGDGTYVSASYISGLDYPEETYELTPGTLSINFQVLDQTLLDSVTGDFGLSTLVSCFKALVDPNTRSVEARFEVFNGFLTGVDVVGNLDTQSVILRCSNSFAQLDENSGRLLSDLTDPPRYEKIYWGSLQV